MTRVDLVHEGPRIQQRCIIIRFVSGVVFIDGCHANGGAMRSRHLRMSPDSVEDFILGLRKEMAGPLGKLALEAERNEATTGVDNVDPGA